jgi:hypothetical protein
MGKAVGSWGANPRRGSNRMSPLIGDKLKSFVTGELFEVRFISESMIILKACDQSSQVWTKKDNLNLFYESVGNGNRPEITR